MTTELLDMSIEQILKQAKAKVSAENARSLLSADKELEQQMRMLSAALDTFTALCAFIRSHYNTSEYF